MYNGLHCPASLWLVKSQEAVTLAAFAGLGWHELGEAVLEDTHASRS
jgi:hypothetical protein